MSTLKNKILSLRKEAGSHSPSISLLREKIPELEIKIDACYLSNPYATDLFISYMEDFLKKVSLKDMIQFYPSLNNTIAEYVAKSIEGDITKDNIFVCNGATEGIQAYLHNFVEGKILINIPTFSPYYEFVKEKSSIIYNDNHSLKNIAKLIQEHSIENVVIINPNNPDGTYISYKDLICFLKRFHYLQNIIVDESFIHFSYEDDSLKYSSLSKVVNTFKNLTIVKSMSKDFGISGIRAGYLLTDPSKVQYLLKNGYLWNINSFSEMFFKILAKESFQRSYKKCRTRYIQETREFFKKLKSIHNINVTESKANFVLIELPKGTDADDFAARLLTESGVYVRSCNNKIGLGNNFIRVSSRTKEENEKIYEGLSKCLE